jgi:hypothetical protein
MLCKNVPNIFCALKNRGKSRLLRKRDVGLRDVALPPSGSIRVYRFRLFPTYVEGGMQIWSPLGAFQNEEDADRFVHHPNRVSGKGRAESGFFPWWNLTLPILVRGGKALQ